MTSNLHSNPLATWLRHSPVLVLDGALATELERRGCDLRDPLWSAKVLIEHPERIREVHYDYFAAGADCAITASYQASVAGFQQRGCSQAEAVALLGRSVQLAFEARAAFWQDPMRRQGRSWPLVAASIGPYGAVLANGSEYQGDYGLSEEQLMAFHRPRIAALLAAGADLLACETIPCLSEARALARLLPEFPNASAWISLSARDARHTCQGESLAEGLTCLNAGPQIVAVGINCTAPRYLPDLLATLRTVTDKPLVAYPNSGEGYDAASGGWHGCAEVADFAEAARHWYAAGARVIGGCCRTTPEHIRAIAAWAHTLQSPARPVPAD